MAQIVQDQTPNASSSQIAHSSSTPQGDHERLFRMLEEEGPAPNEFMLGLSDPLIERENIFEDWDDT